MDGTKSRSTLHVGAHLLQIQEVEKKEEVSASVRRWDVEWRALGTVYSVCVNNLKSLNINKPFVCSQLGIFVHHMMYFWGLCLHWATQPICEAKWEQIMMATVPISLGTFLCCLLIGTFSNTWLNHHLLLKRRLQNNSAKKKKKSATSLTHWIRLESFILFFIFPETLKQFFFKHIFKKVYHAHFLTSTR